ncbi:MAG: hypothetical protein ABR530_03225 [Pyrinomonadaceae bacterium]
MTGRRTFLIAATAAFIVFFAVHFLDFPGSVPRFRELSGGGVLFDLTPSFDIDEVYQRLNDYGPQGRESYKFRNQTVDIILPLGLLPFLFLLMLTAVRSMQLNGWPAVLFLAIPVAYVIFDLLENGVVLGLLNTYPHRMDGAAQILPYITTVKRAASLLALIIPLTIFTLRFFRKTN